MIPETILAFWRFQLARGQPAEAVWVLYHVAGSVQPAGRICGWNVSKSALLKDQAERGYFGDVCQPLPDHARRGPQPPLVLPPEGQRRG